MEVVVPLFALTGLYLVDKQTKQGKEQENFENNKDLPNTNIPDANYLQEDRVESSDLDNTAELTVLNKFNNQSGVYTDKYFQPSQSKSNETTNLDYVSLSGQRVSGNYFEHNNMTPYFGGNIRGTVKDANSYEGLLDSYTGSGSQDISKKEQSPLFTPEDNLQWAHGAPNQTDFVKSRINPSMKMANVNPFEEKQVAPGLGLGYTTEGADGFNSGMMNREAWQPKTVDELRVDSNPRASGVSLMGHEGPANSHIKHIATAEQMGVMEKHRPERSFALDERNVGGNDIGRLFVTGGLEKGHSLRSIPVESHVTRPETSTDYAGIAGAQHDAAYVPGEYMPSHNQQLGAVPVGVANARGRSRAGENDYSIRSNKAYTNNRSANQQDSYFGAVGNSLGAAVAPLLDILKPSRKENMIGTMRPYQNPGSSVSQSYVFNPADKPAPTIRETTENSKYHLNVNANQRGGAYNVTEHQVADTTRNETGNFYYAGNAGAGAGARQTTSYEAGYNQRNNDIKSSTIDGYMVKGNMSLLNSDVNVRQKERDGMLKNERSISGNMPYRAPDVSGMGVLSGNVKEYNTNIQMERTAPEMMLNLQSNPYVVDYKKGL
jgi:hypothetical protein|uniref:DUF5899 domain-containing protein n=1 Tax=viral metagenome TaxID=1070528 RepID=A0A6C0IQA9_9ZZZZ